MPNMRLDCEIISQDFLPALRSAIAKELISCGMNQKEVADLIGISQPAVSQYLRDLRGANNHFVLDKDLFSKVREMCGKMKSKEMNHLQMKREMYSLCEAALNRKQN